MSTATAQDDAAPKQGLDAVEAQLRLVLSVFDANLFDGTQHLWLLQHAQLWEHLRNSAQLSTIQVDTWAKAL